MPCYEVQYRHSRGLYVASKWAESAGDALEAVKKAHRRAGLSSAVGYIVYDDAELVIPQPFSDEAREQRRNREESVKVGIVSLPSVEVDFSAREEPEPIGDNEAEGAPEPNALVGE